MAARPQLPEEMAQVAPASLNNGAADPAAITPDSPIRVFLVEDHQVVREGTRRLLEVDGDIKVVGETSSGEDGVESPELSHAHVALVDMILPGIDGIETTRRMVARYPDLRVVILSSFGEGYVIEALESGAAGYLLKRTEQDELIRAVREAAAGGSPMSGSLNAMLIQRFRESLNSSSGSALTPRQKEVLTLVAQGETTRAISDNLFMSTATVKRELRNVFDKLGVGNRAHAVAKAQQQGLI